MEIILKNNFNTIFDDEDYPLIRQYGWCSKKCGNSIYVVSSCLVQNNKKRIYMHRLIMGLDFGDKRQIDHINHNGLDNRKINLRIVSKKQNMANRKKPIGLFSSKYKGVSYKKDHFLWRSSIKINNKIFHLGYFNEEKEAAVAYNNAAIRYFGEYACINVID